MDGSEKACAATPAATLEQHIMDVNIPKSEAEWWAHQRIEQLERELADEREACAKVADDWASGKGLHGPEIVVTNIKLAAEHIAAAIRSRT